MLNRDIPIQACNAESRGKNLLQFNISIARRSVTANFCLQTFPAPISVFAINYLKYWNYCKYRGATAYLRAPTGTFPAALVTYLFECAPNVHLQPTLETFDRKIWICRTMRCRPTWDQNIKGSVTHWNQGRQKSRFAGFQFCCKIRRCLREPTGRPPSSHFLFVCRGNKI